MRKILAAPGQVFTTDRRRDGCVIDFKQYQPASARIIFLRSAQYLGALGAMNESLLQQIGAGKLTPQQCRLPIGHFRNSVNHDFVFDC